MGNMTIKELEKEIDVICEKMIYKLNLYVKGEINIDNKRDENAYWELVRL